MGAGKYIYILVCKGMPREASKHSISMSSPVHLLWEADSGKGRESDWRKVKLNCDAVTKREQSNPEIPS